MAKTALLIGTSHYQSGFEALPAAPKDVAALQAVLQNPEIGQFDEVQTLVNKAKGDVDVAIETWFRQRQRNDLALLYFSGHGVKDDRGKLYFAVSNTRKEGDFLISSTAISAAFVHECILQSRARRQVVILDCCFSGAFGNLTVKDDGALNLVEQLGAEGRVVLTSSSAVQYSFEQPGSDLSIYTRYLVEGIETGAADLNKDGHISVDELHQYAELKVKEAAPAMSPKIIVLKDEGFRIELAKVALGDPKLLYRQEVERVVHENQGFISDLDRLDLDDICAELNLGVFDAEEIESSVLQPFRELEERVEFYRRAFQTAITQEYPLDELQRRKLKRIQDRKQLRNEDVQRIESQIFENVQTYKKPLIKDTSTPDLALPTFEKPKHERKLESTVEPAQSTSASAFHGRYPLSPLNQWIEQICYQPNLHVRARQQGNVLHVLLEAPSLPRQAEIVEALVEALQLLNINTLIPSNQALIYQVILYGRKQGESRPAWARPIHLNQLPKHLAELQDDDMQRIEAQVITMVQPVETVEPSAPISKVPKAPKLSEEDDLSSEKGIDYSRLRNLLKAGEWKEADNETYLRMLEVVGCQKGDWIHDEELLNFPCADLKTINQLWVKYSDGQFGFSVQKDIYVQCGAELDDKYPGDKIWRIFCKAIGWRTNSSYVYYPDITFGTSAPRGHLPGVFCGTGLGVTLFSRIQTCKV